MRKVTLLLFAFLISVFAFAQKKNLSQSDRSIVVSLDRSVHGTGDLKGIKFDAMYGKYFRKRWEWSAGFSTTIHYGSAQVILDYNGSKSDASFRYTTAGLQAQGQLGFAAIKTHHHELKLFGGTLIRFQSSSYPDMYSFYLPSATIPEPLFSFRHYEKQNVFTAGYLAGASYAYTFNNKIFIGANSGFQGDTNGDIITYYGVQVGKRF